MILWIDAQLSPSLALWIQEEFQIESYSLKFLGLRDAKDHEIFSKAKETSRTIAIMTKDSDFLVLLNRLKSPPKIILVTAGNTSNEKMKEILRKKLKNAIHILESGEDVVEIY